MSRVGLASFVWWRRGVRRFGCGRRGGRKRWGRSRCAGWSKNRRRLSGNPVGHRCRPTVRDPQTERDADCDPAAEGGDQPAGRLPRRSRVGDWSWRRSAGSFFARANRGLRASGLPETHRFGDLQEIGLESRDRWVSFFGSFGHRAQNDRFQLHRNRGDQRGATGSACACMYKMSECESASNGSFPVNMRKQMMPNA